MKTTPRPARNRQPQPGRRQRKFARRHAATAFCITTLLAGIVLPRTGEGVVVTFKAAATPSAMPDLNLATNYTNNVLPNSTNDVRLSSTGTALTLSTGSIVMQSLNVSTANVTTAYTIQNTTTGALNTTITLGNTSGAQTNVFAANVLDLIYLNTGTTGNLSLTIQGANTSGGTGTLGLVLANSGNFDVTIGTTLNISAAITGNFGVMKTNTGTLNLSGNNTFTAFTAGNGVTNLGADGALGGVATLTVSAAGVLNAANVGATSYTNLINDAAAVTLNVNASNGAKLNLAGSTETIGSLATSITGGGSGSLATLTIGDFVNGATTTAGSLTVGNGSATTFAGIIAGTHAGTDPVLIKQGTGTLTLNGANTFTGGVALNGGVISLGVGETGNAGPLGLGGTISFNGGGLQYSSSNNYDYSSRFSPTGTQLYSIDTGGADVTFASALTGTGSSSLTKAGSGTLTLSGASTFTGGVNLVGGVVSLGRAEVAGTSGPLGNGGTISFNGGTLQYAAANNAFDYSSRFSNADNQRYRIATGGQNVTLASALTSNGGTFTKLGTGVLTLSGANSFNGAVTLTGGTVRLGIAEDLVAGTGPLGSGGSITFNGGTLQYSSNNNTDYSPRFSSVPGQNFNINTNGVNVAFAAPLASVGGSLTKAGAGILTLNGASTFDGAVNINGGTLQVAATETAGTSGPLGTGGTISFSGGGVLQYSPTNNSDYSSRFSSAAAQVYNIDTNGQNVTFASALGSANGSLNKMGLGTLTLSASSPFTGGVTLTSGFVLLNVGDGAPGSPGALGASGPITFSGGTLQYSANNTVDYSSRFAATGSEAYRINTSGQDVTFASPLGSGSGANSTSGLFKGGGGTLILSAANTFTGNVNINGGTLRVNAAETAGTSGPLGTNGKILFGGGTLQYSTNNNFDYSSRFSANANQMVSIATNTQNVTFASDLVSSGGTLTKLGGGILTLTGANTYTGGTTVTAGVLQVNNAIGTSGTGSGALTVATGGTLQGTGFIDAGTNAVTISGRLSPGAGTGAAGTLSFTSTTGSTLTLAATSTLSFDITNLGNKDLVSLGNNPLALNGGTLALVLPDTSSTGIDYTQTYALFTGVSGLSMATMNSPFSMVTGYDTLDYMPVFTLNGTEYDLTFVPTTVPEPSALVGCAVLLAGAVGWRQRRRLRGAGAGSVDVKLPA